MENCGSALVGEDANPERHQVTDIPPVVAETVEYQMHALGCGECDHTTRASLPEGVSWSPFGPRLQALVAALGGVWRMPKRSIREFLSDALGVTISLGAISNVERTVSEALRTAIASRLCTIAGP